MRWFDSHLDLACLALEGRDMRAADPGPSGGQNPPGSVTFPSLLAGNVTDMLATIFIEPEGSPESIAYTPGEDHNAVSSACIAAHRQMELYEQWEREGHLRLVTPGPVARADAALEMGAERAMPAGRGIRTRILVEGADGIRSPEELHEWHARGVAAVSLAWAKQTRYAGGNGCETGLTPLGRDLIKEMDRLGVTHDVSHLSDASLRELLELTDRPVIASHSNCRSLLDDGSLSLAMRQRHLADDSIREIGRRGGMVGSVLFGPFIVRGGKRDRRATLNEWALHADRLAELLGSRSRVGLGSDADGGFSALMLPDGIDRPEDYVKLAETLRTRGWSDTDIAGFAHANWHRFWTGTS